MAALLLATLTFITRVKESLVSEMVGLSRIARHFGKEGLYATKNSSPDDLVQIEMVSWRVGGKKSFAMKIAREIVSALARPKQKYLGIPLPNLETNQQSLVSYDSTISDGVRVAQLPFEKGTAQNGDIGYDVIGF